MNKNEKVMISGHFAAMLTILIWGTTYISTKVLLRSFQPVEILFIRFVIGFIILCLVCPHRLKTGEGQQKYFVLAGLFGITLYYLLENIALVYTQATNVGVIISAAPFFTAILSRVFLKEGRLSKNFMVGFFLAMIGIILLSYQGKMELNINPLGDILALLAAVVWAAYSIVTKKISSFGYSSIMVTRRTFFYGILFMIPVMFMMDYHPDYMMLKEPVILGNMLFLGIGASALCFVTWNIAVRILGAVRTSIYIYLVPVITTVTSVLILHEKVGKLTIIGIVCTLAGLFLSQKKEVVETKGESYEKNIVS